MGKTAQLAALGRGEQQGVKRSVSPLCFCSGSGHGSWEWAWQPLRVLRMGDSPAREREGSPGKPKERHTLHLRSHAES